MELCYHISRSFVDLTDNDMEFLSQQNKSDLLPAHTTGIDDKSFTETT